MKKLKDQYDKDVLSIAGINLPALVASSSTRVAFIDEILDELRLRTYDFDGTNWAPTGAGIAGISSPVLAVLSSTRVAFIDSTLDNLRTYDFDGTNWAQELAIQN